MAKFKVSKNSDKRLASSRFLQAHWIQTSIAWILVEVPPQVIQFRSTITAHLLQNIDIHEQLPQGHPMIYTPERHRPMQALNVIMEAHSKYNPIERCWAALELFWNGAVLDSIEVAIE